MKRLLLLTPILLCAFNYGYKNNPQTGKPDMVVTGATTSDISTPLTGVLYGNGSVISTATNAQLPSMSATVGGAVPTPPNDATKFLDGTGGFTIPPGTYVLPITDSVSTTSSSTAASATAVKAANDNANTRLLATDQAADSAKLGGIAAATVVAGAAAGATAQQPDNTAWSTYSPNITPAAGAFGATVTGAGRYKQIGKTIFLNVTFIVLNNGTGGSYVIVPLPVAPYRSTMCLGMEDQVVGFLVMGEVNTSGHYNFTKTDNTYPVANGYGFNINVTYEVP